MKVGRRMWFHISCLVSGRTIRDGLKLKMEVEYIFSNPLRRAKELRGPSAHVESVVPPPPFASFPSSSPATVRARSSSVSEQDRISPDLCYFMPGLYAYSSIFTPILSFACLRQREKFCLLPKLRY